MAETFSTSPLKPLNRIQRNYTRSKISMFSTKFVFFGPIRKQKWPPWLIPKKGSTLYSGARYVALWVSCFLIICNMKYFRFSRRILWLQVARTNNDPCVVASYFLKYVEEINGKVSAKQFSSTRFLCNL